MAENATRAGAGRTVFRRRNPIFFLVRLDNQEDRVLQLHGRGTWRRVPQNVPVHRDLESGVDRPDRTAQRPHVRAGVGREDVVREKDRAPGHAEHGHWTHSVARHYRYVFSPISGNIIRSGRAENQKIEWVQWRTQGVEGSNSLEMSGKMLK